MRQVDVGAHAFLQVAAEQGTFGLIPFLMLHWLCWRDLSAVWRVGRHNRKKIPRLGAIATRAAMVQTGFVGLLVVAQFQPTLRHKALWLVFALSTILVRIVQAEMRAEGVQQPERVPPALPALESAQPS